MNYISDPNNKSLTLERRVSVYYFCPAPRQFLCTYVWTWKMSDIFSQISFHGLREKIILFASIIHVYFYFLEIFSPLVDQSIHHDSIKGRVDT